MFSAAKDFGFVVSALACILFYHVAFFLLFVIESLFALVCFPLIKLDGGTWKQCAHNYLCSRRNAWRRFTSGDATMKH